MEHPRIGAKPQVVLGKPVIRGTRITVELILRKLGAGMTAEEIIADRRHLTVDDIGAAQTFAADYMADEDIAHGCVVKFLADECCDAGLVAALREMTSATSWKPTAAIRPSSRSPLPRSASF